MYFPENYEKDTILLSYTYLRKQMFQKNLHPKKDQDSSTEKLCFCLKPISEPVSEPDTGQRQQKRNDTDERHRTPDRQFPFAGNCSRDIQHCKCDAHCQCIDTGGYGKNKQIFRESYSSCSGSGCRISRIPSKNILPPMISSRPKAIQ